MRTGTVVRASRRQKFFDVVWDGAEKAVTLTIDDLIPNEHSAGKSDMLDGREVANGDRVVEARTPNGRMVQATGENWPCESAPEPEPDKGIETTEQFERHLKTLNPAEATLARWLTNHLPMDDDAETEYGF